MKKILFTAVFTAFLTYGYSQYLLPVKISTNPDSIEIAVTGAFSADGGSNGFIESLTSKTDFGYAVNFLVNEPKFNKRGKKIVYKQFIVNINPLIIDWDPFMWNTLVKHPIDSFNVQKLPFSDNSLLHIGFRSNSIVQTEIGSSDKRVMHSFWVDMFWTPYSFESDSKDLRFQTFNINAGYQYNFYKTNVPRIGTFLFGFSPQICFTGVNESQEYQDSFKEAINTNQAYDYSGQTYVGPGAKIVIQMNNLNIFVEGRQYYGIEDDYSGDKFSDEPVIIVGAYANLKFITRGPKKKTNSSNKNNGGWR